MKKLLLILLFFISSSVGFCKASDTLTIQNLNSKFEEVKNQLKEVRRDELNYRIEKDLLKETYQNNYERISLFITLVLGIIGVLGYLGIKDINAIKKEYMAELSNLKQLQNDLAAKVKEFEYSKEKYDTELTDILKTNDEQNKKIKVLELKDKISTLFKDNQYVSALEFCNAALELAKEDIPLLLQKANIYTRMRNYKDSISIYNKLREVDNENNLLIFNLSEVYLLNRQKDKYDELIAQNKKLFDEKIDGKLLEIYSLVINYNDKNIANLTEYALANISNEDFVKRKRIEHWDFMDILLYLGTEPNTEETIITQNIMWFLNGQISGNDFYKRTDIAAQISPINDTKDSSQENV